MNNRYKLATLLLIAVAVVVALYLVFGRLNTWQLVIASSTLVGALVAVAALLLRPSTPDGVAGCAGYRDCAVWLLVLGGGVLVAFSLVWSLVKFSTPIDGSAEIALPLIVMVGVVILLIVVGLVTFTYSVLGLTSPKEALGLPDGSVRAIIALMLLVLFTIVSIFLYNNVAANGTTKTVEHLNQEQVNTMQQRLSVILAQPDGGSGTFRVLYKDTNQAGDDLAKQLIVLLGTLVTAVASFYFGSNAVASASAAVLGTSQPPRPRLTSIAPNPIRPGDQQVELTGSDFGSVTQLRLERGARQIPATAVSASDTEVTGRVNVPNDAPAGKWNVVIGDGGKSTTIAHIQFSGESQATQDSTKTDRPITIIPATISAGTTTTVKVGGPNLEQITALHLQNGGTLIHALSPVEAASTLVTAKIVIPADAPPGTWDVFLGDEASSKKVGTIEIKAS